MTYRLSV